MYNAMLKRTEVPISGTSYFIAPFPVFVSVRITALFTKTLSPVLGGLVALLGEGNEDGDSEDPEEIPLDEARNAIPAFTEAMSSINPYDFEKLMRELLINAGNIAWKNGYQTEGEILTEDALNAIMAGNSQDLYILAYHVLKINFSGFFEKFRNLSGNPIIKTIMEKASSPDTESSMPPVLRTLN